jgi:serine-type D-Ala-D-Ala carboxypeptidase/endopeptidase (penicillin-binding protein 4)
MSPIRSAAAGERKAAHRSGAVLALLGMIAAALGSALPAAAQDRLPEAVIVALQRAEIPTDAFAAVALPLERQGLPWRHNAERAMQPGSTMKLVTSVVALDRLGPNHRGFTELRSAASVEGDTLRGPLVLRGGLDPDLGIAEFWMLLRELRHQGIRHIEGDLIVDRTLLEPARPDRGVPYFDEAPEFPYNVIPDALNLVGSLLPLELRATHTGVEAVPVPLLDGLTVDASAMTLNDRPCAQWSREWQMARARTEADGRVVVALGGAFPRECTRRAALQILDRQIFTERLFATLWRELGGTWSGSGREPATSAELPVGTRVLARRESRAWGELLRDLNKRSDNAWTRQLFYALGAAHAEATGLSAGAAATRDVPAAPRPPTAALSDRVIRSWFEEHGIDPEGLVTDNGSGLSRSERISPQQMARMLRVAHRSRHAPELMMSLPVAGVDGTMRARLTDSPATGWARLKTGTLWNVNALAGYVRDDRGGLWAVAMMVNHPHSSRSRPVLDAFVDWVARGGSREPPPVFGAWGGAWSEGPP